MPRKPVIAIVGTGREIEPAISEARELGRLIAEQGWVLITGGRNAGVMKAANQGAKKHFGSDVDDTGRNATVSESGESGKNIGITVGILPNVETDISPDVDIAIITETGEARNNIIVLTADAVIACGVDDPGTTSEVALALKAQKPVVLLGAGDEAKEFFTGICGNAVRIADSPEDGIEIITELLKVPPARRATE